MRLLAVMLVVGGAVDALAQESPPPSAQPYPIVEPAPPPPPPHQPMMDPATVALTAPPPRVLPSETVARWRSARALQVSGGVIGLISTGLSLSSTIYILATGYPPSATDFVRSAKPSDTGPILAYLGSGTSVVGFALSAAGLGWQHHILGDLGADPGRGIFIGGTVVGILGTLAAGAGYFMAFTDYLNPHDQSIAVLATTLTGAALCTTAAALFAKDSSRMKKTWRGLMTF